MAYSATFKQWDHVGSITPNMELSEPHRPYGDFQPAHWLPVGRYDKHFEEYGRWKSSTALAATLRYSSDVSAGDDIVGLVLPNVTVAHNTANTPWSFSNTTVFANEVAEIGAILAAGDYMIDHDVGIILMFETDGNAAPISSGTIDYYHYDSVPVSVGTYGAVVGEVRPGDFLKADANSNFVKATAFAAGDVVTAVNGNPSDAELADMMNQVMDAKHEVIGQLLDEDIHPKDYLGHVRTAYENLGTMEKMPGSATKGLPSSLTYSGGGVRMVRIMLLR
jgi:hypothetical protein